MSEGSTPAIPHTAVAASAGRSSASRWESSAPIRYPDPDIIVLDPRFQAMVLGNAAIERIATGFRFTEGPVYYGDGRSLVFSDIPNDALLRWDEITGVVAPLRQPTGNPDGTLLGRILLPERCANLCFGGCKRNRLFMPASQSVYALYIEAQGNPGG